MRVLEEPPAKLGRGVHMTVRRTDWLRRLLRGLDAQEAYYAQRYLLAKTHLAVAEARPRNGAAPPISVVEANADMLSQVINASLWAPVGVRRR